MALSASEIEDDPLVRDLRCAIICCRYVLKRNPQHEAARQDLLKLEKKLEVRRAYLRQLP